MAIKPRRPQQDNDGQHQARDRHELGTWGWRAKRSRYIQEEHECNKAEERVFPDAIARLARRKVNPNPGEEYRTLNQEGRR